MLWQITFTVYCLAARTLDQTVWVTHILTHSDLFVWIPKPSGFEIMFWRGSTLKHHWNNTEKYHKQFMWLVVYSYEERKMPNSR